MSNTSPAESRTSEIAKGWLGILVVGGLAWYYFGGGLEKQADQDLYRIETKVAQDSVQEYEIANRHGDNRHLRSRWPGCGCVSSGQR
jgi:hypothetical protein